MKYHQYIVYEYMIYIAVRNNVLKVQSCYVDGFVFSWYKKSSLCRDWEYGCDQVYEISFNIIWWDQSPYTNEMSSLKVLLWPHIYIYIYIYILHN